MENLAMMGKGDQSKKIKVLERKWRSISTIEERLEKGSATSFMSPPLICLLHTLLSGGSDYI